MLWVRVPPEAPNHHEETIMKKILAALFICAALVSGSVSAHGWHGGYRGGYHAQHYGYRHDGGHWGRGFIVGAIVGGIIGQQFSQPTYYAQPGVVYVQPAPQYYTQRVPVYCTDYYGRSYVCGWQYVQVPQQ